jgi:hypothetical protein
MGVETMTNGRIEERFCGGLRDESSRDRISIWYTSSSRSHDNNRGKERRAAESRPKRGATGRQYGVDDAAT